jgi:hypothetical protein
MFAEPVVTHAEIEQVFSPYVSTRFSRTSPDYEEQLALQSAKLTKRRNKALLVPDPQSWQDGTGARTADRVQAGYERAWATVSLREQLGSAKSTWFEWDDEIMLARTIGRKHLHQLLLVRAIERIAPGSIAEVGFGNGFNLLLLAMQFPSLSISGVELTQAGVDAAYASGSDPRTSDLLSPFVVNEVRQPPLLPASLLRQGRADALPLDSKSVDVAFTTLALEQMNEIRTDALRELARVARRFVIMIEPFRDWNTDGVRRRYVEHHGYFDAWVADLESVGLNPLVATADMPNKISFHVGLVIAAVGQ